MTVPAQDLVVHFRRQRQWTRKLVAAVPEERFGWAPAPESFSCGDLVRHLMQAEVFWRRLIVAAAAGRPFDPFGLEGDPEERREAFRERNLEASRLARWGTTFRECLERWSSLEDETAEALAGLTPEGLERVTVHPLTGLRAATWEMVLVMMQHEAHHRGQLSAYLKGLGLEQPGLFGAS